MNNKQGSIKRPRAAQAAIKRAVLFDVGVALLLAASVVTSVVEGIHYPRERIASLVFAGWSRVSLTSLIVVLRMGLRRHAQPRPSVATPGGFLGDSALSSLPAALSIERDTSGEMCAYREADPGGRLTVVHRPELLSASIPVLMFFAALAGLASFGVERIRQGEDVRDNLFVCVGFVVGLAATIGAVVSKLRRRTTFDLRAHELVVSKRHLFGERRRRCQRNAVRVVVEPYDDAESSGSARVFPSWSVVVEAADPLELLATDDQKLADWLAELVAAWASCEVRHGEDPSTGALRSRH